MSAELDAVATIRDRVAEVGKALGLELMGFTVIPGEKKGGVHIARTMWRIVDKPDATDKTFQEMVEFEHQQERQEKFHEEKGAKVEQNLDALKERLQRGKGIINDGD